MNIEIKDVKFDIKLEWLNKQCRGTFGIEYYCNGWEISSFGKNTPFRNKFVKNLDIRKAVNRAIEIILESGESELLP